MLEKMVSTLHPDPLSVEARLWRNRSFTTFWIGQTLSVLGDAFTLVALPLLVLLATGSVIQMGLVTAIIGICRTATGLFAGWLADHRDRLQLLIFCDVARTFLYFALPLFWWLLGAQLWMIYALAALSSCLGMIFQVTFGTMVTNLVDPDQLTLANGRLQTTFSLSGILGPILAGLVCSLFHPAVALAVDGCSFLLSTISLFLIQPHSRKQSVPAHQDHAQSPEREVPPSRLRPRQPFWQALLVGLHFIWNEPLLRAQTILLFFINLMNAGIVDIVIFHLKYDLGQNDSIVGIVLGCACIGGMIAGILGPYGRKLLGFGPCWIGGFALYFVAIFLIGFSMNVLLINILVILLSFTMTLTAICSISLRQQITPDALLGRVTSAALMIVTALAPVGAVLFTALTARFGSTLALGGMGMCGFLLVCIAILTPIRQRFPERRVHTAGAVALEINDEAGFETSSVKASYD